MSERCELRVALLSPSFWPEIRRGGERFVSELAHGLMERGHQPRLITSHPGRTTRTVENGLPIVRHRRPPALLEGRLEDHIAHVPRTYVSLRRGDYDVAHAVFPTDALAAARWAARSGKPSVFSYLGLPDRQWLSQKRLRLGSLTAAARRCSATTALSAAAAEAFRAELGVEVPVIYPGVDLAAFAPASERTEGPTIFCAAAIDHPAKRVPLLIEAFAGVRRQRPDARLILSRPGDRVGPDRAGAPLPPGVELLDVDDHAALVRAYGQAWVSALPSLGEAFGLVLLEALACGTPGVGTDSGGIPEVLDRPEVGRLFRGAEPEDLTRALLEALELAADPATAAACRAQAGRFSTARCVDAYERLYRDLVG